MSKKMLTLITLLVIATLALTACKNPRAERPGNALLFWTWGDKTLPQTLELQCVGGGLETTVEGTVYPCPGTGSALPPTAPGDGPKAPQTSLKYDESACGASCLAPGQTSLIAPEFRYGNIAPDDAMLKSTWQKIVDQAKLAGITVSNGPTMDDHQAWLVLAPRSCGRPSDVSEVLNVYAPSSTLGTYIQVPFDRNVAPRTQNTWQCKVQAVPVH